ncbi:MAG: double zinc ribbon domain-containing protein, partial [Acidimicrobiales bacterium]
MIELVVGVLVAGAAVWFVLLPILKPDTTGALSRHEDRAAEGEGDDPDDDFSPRAVALRALKEIEFDRATGKLSDTDYESLRTTYTADALAALRAEEPGAARRETGGAGAVPPPISRLPSPACPTCGPRPERDAGFCSTCGRRLSVAPGFCSRCGTGLESDASY